MAIVIYKPGLLGVLIIDSSIAAFSNTKRFHDLQHCQKQASHFVRLFNSINSNCKLNCDKSKTQNASRL